MWSWKSAACIVLIFALPARAGDELTPTRLALKSKVRDVAVGPDGTLYFLEGSVVRNSEQKDEPGEHKVFAWDLEKNKEAGRIEGIPAGAVSMAVIGDKLVVACGKEGLAVVDLESKAVKVIKDDKVAPKWVSPDSSRGHALVIVASRFRGNMLAKVALESEHGVGIPTGTLGSHVAATTDAIVVQSPFTAGGMSGQDGWPTFYSNLPGTSPKMFQGSPTSALPYQQIQNPTALKGTSFGWRISFGPFRAVNGGTNFVVTQHPRLRATDEGTAVICLDADCSKVLWTVESSSLLGVSSKKPLAVLRKSEGDPKKPPASVSKWAIEGVNVLDGKPLWNATVSFAAPIEETWPYDPSPLARTIVSSGGDHLVFAVKDAKATADEPIWYSVALPKAGLDATPFLRGALPDTVHVGGTFTFAPTVEHAQAGTKFSLKAAPEGMTIDPKTAAISWTPGPKAIKNLGELTDGRHQVVVAAQMGGEERIVTSFEVEVLPAAPRAPGPPIPNPAFVAWSKVEKGWSYTVKCAWGTGDTSEATFVLMSKNDKKVVISELVNGQKAGDGMEYPAMARETAKTDAAGGADLAAGVADPLMWTPLAKGKKLGTDEIKAAGKSFSCEVWQIDGEDQNGAVILQQWICPGSLPEIVKAHVTTIGRATKIKESLTYTLEKVGAVSAKGLARAGGDAAGAGLIDVRGDRGADGASAEGRGQRGKPGEKGEEGGEVVVTLTYKVEKSGDKFVRVQGTAKGQPVDFVFNPKTDKLQILATGGKGGTGGQGSQGVDKGPNDTAGKGGTGGKGGRGGKGGKVVVHFEAGHPELKDLVSIDNSGGDGGDPGPGGPSGAGAVSNGGDSGETGEKGPDGPAPVLKAAEK